MNEEEFEGEPITTNTIHFRMRDLTLKNKCMEDLAIRDEFSAREWLDKAKVIEAIEKAKKFNSFRLLKEELGLE